MLWGERTIRPLKEVINQIRDPFDPRGKRHDVHETIIMVIVAFLCQKRDFVNMEHFLKLKENELKRFLVLENGIPSHDTLGDHMAAVDNDEVTYLLADWFAQFISAESKHIIIDGKGLRAAARKNKSQNVPYILNVIEESSKMIIMQYGVGEKTNEIPEIFKLLDYIDLKNAIVTIDAIGSQEKIMNKIVKEKGHFVLPVKENQGTLHSDIDLYLKKLIENGDARLQKEVTVEKSHGREEKRTYYCINSDECIMDERFGHIRSVGKVIRQRKVVKYNEDQEETGKETVEEVIYVTDLKDIKVKEFSRYIRKHWTIENSLHWILDNTFKEDRCTSKKNLESLSLMRKSAYNIFRLAQRKIGKKPTEYILDELTNDFEELFKYICEPITIE